MNKKRKLAIVIIIALGVVGGIIFASFVNKNNSTHQSAKNSPSSPNNDNPPPPSQSDDNSKKKNLAKQIKEDLQKDLAEAKKSDTLFSKSWLKWNGIGCDCNGDGRGWRLIYEGSTETVSGKEKKKRGEIWVANELEPDDWKAIEDLIQQIDNVNREIEKKQEQKNREWKVEQEQKLKSNPKMFFYEGLGDWEDATGRHFFLGWGDGKKYLLVFPENHPAIASLPNNKGDNPHLKQTGFYLVEGVENITFQPNKVGLYPWKEVNLSDKITIASANS